MGTLMKMGSILTPTQTNENTRVVQVVFSRNDLLNSNIMGVERSTYFPSGSSPVHAESPTEEIIYFRRGHGKVLLDDRYVDVGPGSAVAIPSGIEHHVVNSGKDFLEHILISVEIGGRPMEKDYKAQDNDLLPEDQSRLLSRLKCRRLTIAQEQAGKEATYADQESVYSISAGFALVHVKLAGTEYEWQYAADATNCIWIPAGVPHYFRNVGDSPLQVVQFQSRT
jgi:mannose-6-phosphate isomerase-like protein (cupin superfamily)